MSISVRVADLVFFDIDDTLHRKSTGIMPDSAYQALKKLRENGVHVGIATGRSPHTFPDYIKRLIHEGIVDIIAGINGQYNCEIINDEYHILSAYPFNRDYIKRIAAYMNDKGWLYGGVSHETMAMSQDRADFINKTMHGISGWSYDPEYAFSHDIYQMLIFVNEEQEAILRADNMIEEGYEILRWHPDCVDLLHANGAKANGIKDICKKLNIPLERTMAFGDGHNDMDMLQTVGYGIAMGDGIPELRSVADYVTGSVEEDGIAHALRHFGMI